jgi:uncharacterized phage protein (TIGR02218 family)
VSYEDDELSVEDSRRVELYAFELPIGARYLTSLDEDITHAGITYTSTPISRSDVLQSSVGQVREMVISLPIDHELVQALVANGIPARNARVTITGLQLRSGETDRVWRGPIKQIASDDKFARLTVPNATDQALSVTLPFAVISRTCNHALYDAGCTVLRDATRRVLPTVSGTPVGTTLVVSSISGKPDQWARFGEVVRVADGERRDILSQVGTTLILDAPFGTIANGDALEVWQGCDHEVTTCRDSFSNVANFGGHPLLPVGNPTAPTGYGVKVQV